MFKYFFSRSAKFVHSVPSLSLFLSLSLRRERKVCILVKEQQQTVGDNKSTITTALLSQNQNHDPLSEHRHEQQRDNNYQQEIMSHVEGEDRSEQPNKVRTTNLIRAIYFLALKTQGRRRMDNIHTCRNSGMTKGEKRESVNRGRLTCDVPCNRSGPRHGRACP